MLLFVVNNCEAIRHHHILLTHMTHMHCVKGGWWPRWKKLPAELATSNLLSKSMKVGFQVKGQGQMSPKFAGNQFQGAL